MYKNFILKRPPYYRLHLQLLTDHDTEVRNAVSNDVNPEITYQNILKELASCENITKNEKFEIIYQEMMLESKSFGEGKSRENLEEDQLFDEEPLYRDDFYNRFEVLKEIWDDLKPENIVVTLESLLDGCKNEYEKNSNNSNSHSNLFKPAIELEGKFRRLKVLTSSD